MVLLQNTANVSFFLDRRNPESSCILLPHGDLEIRKATCRTGRLPLRLVEKAKICEKAPEEFVSTTSQSHGDLCSQHSFICLPLCCEKGIDVTTLQLRSSVSSRLPDVLSVTMNMRNWRKAMTIFYCALSTRDLTNDNHLSRWTVRDFLCSSDYI